MKLIYILLSFIFSTTVYSHSVKQARLDEAKRSMEQRYWQEQIQLSKGTVEALEEEQNIIKQEIIALRNELYESAKQINDLKKNSEEIYICINKLDNLLNKEVSLDEKNISGREHVVETGHTLSAIALAYGASVDEIKRVNNLSNDNIYVGQKLFIPE
ncbi:MAG: LysM peptidoglycan-binding domain-containing protein [Pontiellaceae bacterium]